MAWSSPLNEKAFTLVEILMVVVLIAILTTIGITSGINFSQDARIAVTNEKMAAIKAAIVGDARFAAAGHYSKQGYESHCQGLPTSLNVTTSELVAMPAAGTCSTIYNPFLKQGWRGPYVSTTGSTAWNVDGWGTAFVYCPTMGAGCAVARTLISCGQDSTCGTANDKITLSF